MYTPKTLTKKHNIGVLMGGLGAERQISLVSGNAVLTALTELGYQAQAIDITTKQPELPTELNLAYNLVHGTYGEDGQLQQYLEDKGIPYTGTGVRSSQIGFDKIQSKQAFQRAEVPTPRSQTIASSSSASDLEIDLPLVIKPPSEGSSIGIHICHTIDEVNRALQELKTKHDQLLVEEFIKGRELTVSIIDGSALPIIEIIPNSGFYDISAKYSWFNDQKTSSAKATQYDCPAQLSNSITDSVQNAALAAYHALDTKIYARIDILLSESGIPYVLESNSLPGMTQTSLLPKAAAQAGLTFPELCLQIADLSLKFRSLDYLSTKTKKNGQN